MQTTTEANEFNRRWTTEHPELGMEPVPIAPYVSPEHFELERERLFRRVWLKIGRVEEIPNAGDYFNKELAMCKTSILIVRGKDGAIHGFHNMCSHRGNKLAWDEQGSCKSFVCKFHGWSYGLDGKLIGVPDPAMFNNLEKSEHGLTPVATDTWAGFIFINLDPRPTETLAEYLAEAGARLGGFRFGECSEWYTYRTELHCNWKVILDSFTEAYHAPYLHGRDHGDVVVGKENPHSHLLDVRIHKRHSSASIFGNPKHRINPVEAIAYQWSSTAIAKRVGFSMDTLPPDVNPTRSPKFAFDLTVFFPNFLVHVAPGFYFTHQFSPLAVDRTLWEGIYALRPPQNAGERFGQEHAQAWQRNIWLEDTGTVERTQSMLNSGAKTHLILQEQEVLLRHNRRVMDDFIGASHGK